jgi:hypothetical protein
MSLQLFYGRISVTAIVSRLAFSTSKLCGASDPCTVNRAGVAESLRL